MIKEYKVVLEADINMSKENVLVFDNRVDNDIAKLYKLMTPQYTDSSHVGNRF